MIQRTGVFSSDTIKEYYVYQPKDDINIFELAKIVPFLVLGLEQTKKGELGYYGSLFLTAKQGIRISKELFASLPKDLAKHFSKFEQ